MTPKITTNGSDDHFNSSLKEKQNQIAKLQNPYLEKDVECFLFLLMFDEQHGGDIAVVLLRVLKNSLEVLTLCIFFLFRIRSDAFQAKYHGQKKKPLSPKMKNMLQISTWRTFLLIINNCSMIKVLLVTITFLALSHSEGTEWTLWNAGPTFPAVQYPPLSSSFTRYFDSTVSQSSYTYRANQYRYVYSNPIFSQTCNLYCGLRSFLTTDTNGAIVCKRDSNFWGIYGSQYKLYCIPDIDKTPACNVSFPDYSNSPSCNMGYYLNQPQYKNYDCCYNNQNIGLPNMVDLTDKSKLTAFYTLRNHE